MLTVSDYEKVLKFASFINKDYDHYIPNVLYALEEYFGLRLTAYTVVNKDAQDKNYVESIYSNAILPEVLTRYQNRYFDTDLFNQRLAHVANTGAAKYVYTITDIGSYDEYYATDYGRIQKNQNLPFQAVIRSSHKRRLPDHVLNIFKAGQDGDFSAHEIALLDKIGRVYSDSVELYKQYLESTSFSRFLDYQTQAESTGMAIVSDRNHVVYSNDYFLRTASALFDTEGVYSAIISLFSAFTQQLGTTPSKMLEPACITVRDYAININPQRIFNGETLQKYLFITLRRQDGTGVETAVDSRQLLLSEEFNFTLRETEIAGLLVEGHDNAQIAANLCINISTVKFHIKNIFRKLGVTKRSAAIVRLIK